MGKFADITGQKFGRLTVICEAPRPAGVVQRHFWLCKCMCGNEKVYTTSVLKSGKIISCGCYQKEKASKRWREVHLTHGEAGTRLYGIWAAMIRRCESDGCKEYPLYGGRGISVCPEWRYNYTTFAAWARENGYDDTAPRGACTIDRIDIDGNYSPDNCRITSQREQSRNRRNNRRISFNGETKTVAEWAEQYGIKYRTLHDRLSYGWDFERCLTQPLRSW